MAYRKNIGTVDRTMRIFVGIALLALVPLAFLGPQVGWGLWGLVGLVPLAAGLAGYCPPYALLGIDTNASGGHR